MERERGRKRRMKIRFTAQQHARRRRRKKMCTKIGGKLCHVKLTYSLSPSLTLSRFSREIDFSLTALCFVCSPHFSDFPFFRSALSLSLCVSMKLLSCNFKINQWTLQLPFSVCLTFFSLFFFCFSSCRVGRRCRYRPCRVRQSTHISNILSIMRWNFLHCCCSFFLFIIPPSTFSLSIFFFREVSINRLNQWHVVIMLTAFFRFTYNHNTWWWLEWGRDTARLTLPRWNERGGRNLICLRQDAEGGK